MADIMELWEIRVPAPRLAEYLAFAARTAEVRRPFGLCWQAVVKTGTHPDELTVLRVWSDEASVRRWRASSECQQVREEGSHLRVGEPRRLYRLLQTWFAHPEQTWESAV